MNDGATQAWVWLAGAHAASTLMMAGVIWFVQVVHYPLMARVGEGGFSIYEREHAARTTLVVMPLMLIEAASACGLAWHLRAGAGALVGWAGLAALILVWISTFAVQVPLHGKLEVGYTPAAHTALLRTNWIRTVLWSIRGLAAVWMLWLVVGGSSAGTT